MKNNFYLVFQTPPTNYKNPFNQKAIATKLESLDDFIEVSNCAVTIRLHKDGRVEQHPNMRNVDKTKLLKRVSK